jgi:UDP-N-acetylglucosamine diphosphorylase/glucosamine-1-phosphate N-acetyltransferase
MPPSAPTAAIIFEDSQGLIAPLDDLRPACLIRTGAWAMIERWPRALNLAVSHAFLRPAIADLGRETLPALRINDASNLPAGDILLINARATRVPDQARTLTSNQAIVEGPTGDIVCAMVTPDVARAVLNRVLAPEQAQGQPHAISAAHPIASAPGFAPIVIDDTLLLSRPWHVRTTRDACLDQDLAMLIAGHRGAPADTGTLHPSIITLGRHPIIVPASASILPGCILDTTAGPIVLDEHALIRPGCSILGPVYLGPHSQVLDRSLIKPHTSIGPWCKVAGEIGGTIFQGFANKAHDGHLGDSFVGEWSNLGAGTTNSNLLNTYAQVASRAAPDARTEHTGQQFLGAIIADHCKFAISSRLMTGCVLHTGVMWAATAPVIGCVPRFAWSTDAGIRSFRQDKFIDIARSVMARRKLTPSPAYLSRLAVLFAQSPALPDASA